MKKILISSFACSPILGSEPGVGWRWILELSKRYEVTVIVHSFFKKDIENYFGNENRHGIVFKYFSPKFFGGDWDVLLNSRLYYLYWQFKLDSYVRKELQINSYWLAHHLTWGTIRFGSHFHTGNVPLVVGPLGGGEASPIRFFTRCLS